MPSSITLDNGNKPGFRVPTRVMFLSIFALSIIIPLYSSAQVAEQSRGLYWPPYWTGTGVLVSNDANTHSPPNRIDMHATSGIRPYRITAAADGWVRFLQDSYSRNGECRYNNYVWIEHQNGEWTKYSHIAYRSARNAGIRVGHFVRAGRVLGIESKVGCASGNHLHFEVAVPDDPDDPIDRVGGYIKGINRVPRVCGIAIAYTYSPSDAPPIIVWRAINYREGQRFSSGVSSGSCG
jgi:murein DD-endopeptidase MepM/ murein hydrolase activator NlpD